MSSHEDKVTAVTAFLVNRAQLRRVTTFEELGRITGQLLRNGGRRRISDPVRREKIAAALHDVDDASMAEKGVMLSALVVHFFDNDAGHRFFDWAYERGIYESDTDPEYRRALHKAQLDKVFAAYPGTTTPNDLSVFSAEEKDVDSAQESDEIYEDVDAG